MKDLKVKNRQLYETIDELRSEHVSLKEQVSKLEEELAAQYLRYRDEFDARKLLIADVNELRYQKEELLAARCNTETQATDKEDSVMLRIALKSVILLCFCSLCCLYLQIICLYMVARNTPLNQHQIINNQEK